MALTGNNTEAKLDATMYKFGDLTTTITVGNTGGDYQSIKDAIDSITDASQLKPYAVLVYPGVYTEDNPIVMKEFISLRSEGGAYVTGIAPSNTNQNIIVYPPDFRRPYCLQPVTIWD